MQKEVEISIQPKDIENNDLILNLALRTGGIAADKLTDWRITKRSIDARKRPMFKLNVTLYLEGTQYRPPTSIQSQYRQVEDAPSVIIVGAGPAGYFAALECLTVGLRPIVLDRGKDVQARRRDLRAIQQDHVVNPDSNYCFGEGGAGTYSDGKLYTRSKKKGSVQRVLQILVEHGADADIMVDTHPHIGSNKLPDIIANIRNTIIDCGGEVRFGAKVTDFVVGNGKIEGVLINGSEMCAGHRVILATGHSARDIYTLLAHKEIRVESQSFALGLRVEHPQSLIDEIQYGQRPRVEGLPAASYRMACQINNHGVFSFCMCPGGLIVPAATAPGEVVVNGMSLSRRDSPYANSGFVTSVGPKEWAKSGFEGTFAGMEFQQAIEQKMFAAGDGSQRAPAQRLKDFLKKRLSNKLPGSSYIPGLHSAPLHDLLPTNLYNLLHQGLKHFDRKMRGYISDEAIVVGVESRTSAPIRIPRDSKTMMHPEVEGLYPCGEGAGYAGGIVSAAIDGQIVARSIYENTQN